LGWKLCDGGLGVIHSADYDDNLSITIGYPKKNRLNVIVDVLRASSTIITALANEIDEIIFLDNEKDLLKLKNEGFLLVGEYKGLKLPKFDINNSPVELLDAISKGNYTKIALKTTNTTKKLANTGGIFIFSSTLNMFATVDLLSSLYKDVKINLMAVGGRNGFTEDLSLVFSIYAFLNDDISINYEFLKDCLSNSKNARYLSSIGYLKDIEFISNINMYDIVPIMVNGVIKRYEDTDKDFIS